MDKILIDVTVFHVVLTGAAFLLLLGAFAVGYYIGGRELKKENSALKNELSLLRGSQDITKIIEAYLKILSEKVMKRLEEIEKSR